MKTHLLQSELWLPKTPQDLFALCSDLEVLPTLIPPRLRFQFIEPRPAALDLDVVIDYRVRLHGFPIKWRGKITAWDPPHRFVDEQVSGPYRLWVHTHTFEESNGGVICHDRVEYAHAGGWLANRLLVKPDLDRIWTHRLDKILARCDATDQADRVVINHCP